MERLIIFFTTISQLQNKIFPMEKIILPAPIVIYYQIHGANIESIVFGQHFFKNIFLISILVYK